MYALCYEPLTRSLTGGLTTREAFTTVPGTQSCHAGIGYCDSYGNRTADGQGVAAQRQVGSLRWDEEHLGLSAAPICPETPSIQESRSRAWLWNRRASAVELTCRRASSQAASNSFQPCITSCSRLAMASACSPAYTVRSCAAPSCSCRT